MKGKLGMIMVAAAIVIGAMATYGRDRENSGEVQKELAESILRFHVLANSDSQEDQNLKLKVKEQVIAYLEPYLQEEQLSLEESKRIVENHKEEVIALAENVIKENGYQYEVTAELTRDFFPVKSYGDVTLPAGEYEAFRIQIGEAQGKNWWCILYPPLCFVDATYGYVPEDSKKMLKNIMDEECYKVITEGGCAKGEVEVRFKLWDLLSGLF